MVATNDECLDLLREGKTSWPEDEMDEEEQEYKPGRAVDRESLEWVSKALRKCSLAVTDKMQQPLIGKWLTTVRSPTAWSPFGGKN
jgi:hypothetical protein